MTDPLRSTPGHRARTSRLSSGQWIAMLAGVVALALVAVWFTVSRAKPPASTAASQAARTVGTGAMADMPGMNMSSDGSVQLTANQIRQFGITFGVVDERMMSTTLRATGVVVMPEDARVAVTTKVGGYVEQLYVGATGVPVSKGQRLLDLYSAEVLAAQEELLLARRADQTVVGGSVPGIPSSSTDLLVAARRRLSLLDVSDALIDEVLRTGRAQRTITIVAPASGVVVEKSVVRGQAINPGSTLFTVADLSRVWVETEVREGNAGALRPGLGVDIEVGALPGQVFKGRIDLIQPNVDSATRTVRARVVVSNSGLTLKPGMFAAVNVTIPSRRTLTVPSSAVINTGSRSVVFVDMGGGRLTPSDIETGTSASDYIEVLAGLEPGQRVVTSAQFLLESESNIGEVMKAMMGQTGSADMKMDMSPAPARPPSSARK